MINTKLLEVNEQHLSELKTRIESCSYFEYDVIKMEIARTEDRIQAIKNGTHGW